MSRNGLIAPLLLLFEHYSPIRDTIKSIVAVTGIEKWKELMLNGFLSWRRFRGPPRDNPFTPPPNKKIRRMVPLTKYNYLYI